MDRFSPFMGFCQKFKFQEGVHMCLVARKKELEKKKLENKFKSRAAYLKACRSWPKNKKSSSAMSLILEKTLLPWNDSIKSSGILQDVW